MNFSILRAAKLITGATSLGILTMKYDRFEDLPVRQQSADLAAKQFGWSKQTEFHGMGDLGNQLQRAASRYLTISLKALNAARRTS